MADLHNGKLLSVDDAILYVLARYWDPLHLKDDAFYRRYVAAVRQALASGGSVEAVADLLRDAKVKDFGVVGFPSTRERRAARKLMEIDVHRDEASA